MIEPTLVVTSFFEAIQARSWDTATAFLADDVTAWWPVTDERFSGDSFIAMQRAYPEGWRITVEEMTADGDRVAARVAVEQDEERFWCHGWYRVGDGRITHVIELWGTEGSETPPEWRRRYAD